MDSDIITRFTEGINKFNSGDFYDCHDILEDIWFDVRGSSRRFYQGLIHLAVGFYHILERDNPKGSASQFNKGIAKLEEYQPEFQGVELKILLQKVRVCLTEIEKLKNGEIQHFRQELLPRIIFDKAKFI